MATWRSFAVLIGSLCLLLGAACTAKAPIETLPQAAEEPLARLVIDLRDPEPFAAGHLPGALNIQLSWGQLRDRIVSYVPDRGQPLAVRASSTSDAEEAAAILLDLGYEDFVRVVPDTGEETATLPVMSAEDLADELRAAAPPIVLDIRSADEFAEGVIPGSIQIDQDHGPEALAGLDPNAHYAVICAGGWRSSQLATYMRNHGFVNVTNVIDGMWAWED